MYMDEITKMWPRRHESPMLRIILWNVIGYERKFRSTQVKRYPLAQRFI